MSAFSHLLRQAPYYSPSAYDSSPRAGPSRPIPTYQRPKPLVNPYTSLSADAFDNFVDGVSSKIRDALSFDPASTAPKRRGYANDAEYWMDVGGLPGEFSLKRVEQNESAPDGDGDASPDLSIDAEKPEQPRAASKTGSGTDVLDELDTQDEHNADDLEQHHSSESEYENELTDADGDIQPEESIYSDNSNGETSARMYPILDDLRGAGSTQATYKPIQGFIPASSLLSSEPDLPPDDLYAESNNGTDASADDSVQLGVLPELNGEADDADPTDILLGSEDINIDDQLMMRTGPLSDPAGIDEAIAAIQTFDEQEQQLDDDLIHALQVHQQALEDDKNDLPELSDNENDHRNANPPTLSQPTSSIPKAASVKSRSASAVIEIGSSSEGEQENDSEGDQEEEATPPPLGSTLSQYGGNVASTSSALYPPPASQKRLLSSRVLPHLDREDRRASGYQNSDDDDQEDEDNDGDSDSYYRIEQGNDATVSDEEDRKEYARIRRSIHRRKPQLEDADAEDRYFDDDDGNNAANSEDGDHTEDHEEAYDTSSSHGTAASSRNKRKWAEEMDDELSDGELDRINQKENGNLEERVPVPHFFKKIKGTGDYDLIAVNDSEDEDSEDVDEQDEEENDIRVLETPNVDVPMNATAQYILNQEVGLDSFTPPHAEEMPRSILPSVSFPELEFLTNLHTERTPSPALDVDAALRSLTQGAADLPPPGDIVVSTPDTNFGAILAGHATETLQADLEMASSETLLDLVSHVDGTLAKPSLHATDMVQETEQPSALQPVLDNLSDHEMLAHTVQPEASLAHTEASNASLGTYLPPGNTSIISSDSTADVLNPASPLSADIAVEMTSAAENDESVNVKPPSETEPSALSPHPPTLFDDTQQEEVSGQPASPNQAMDREAASTEGIIETSARGSPSASAAPEAERMASFVETSDAHMEAAESVMPENDKKLSVDDDVGVNRDLPVLTPAIPAVESSESNSNTRIIEPVPDMSEAAGLSANAEVANDILDDTVSTTSQVEEESTPSVSAGSLFSAVIHAAVPSPRKPRQKLKANGSRDVVDSARQVLPYGAEILDVNALLANKPECSQDSVIDDHRDEPTLDSNIESDLPAQADATESSAEVAAVEAVKEALPSDDTMALDSLKPLESRPGPHSAQDNDATATDDTSITPDTPDAADVTVSDFNSSLLIAPYVPLLTEKSKLEDPQPAENTPTRNVNAILPGLWNPGTPIRFGGSSLEAAVREAAFDPDRSANLRHSLGIVDNEEDGNAESDTEEATDAVDISEVPVNEGADTGVESERVDLDLDRDEEVITFDKDSEAVDFSAREPFATANLKQEQVVSPSQVVPDDPQISDAGGEERAARSMRHMSTSTDDSDAASDFVHSLLSPKAKLAAKTRTPRTSKQPSDGAGRRQSTRLQKAVADDKQSEEDSTHDSQRRSDRESTPQYEVPSAGNTPAEELEIADLLTPPRMKPRVHTHQHRRGAASRDVRAGNENRAAGGGTPDRQVGSSPVTTRSHCTYHKLSIPYAPYRSTPVRKTPSRRTRGSTAEGQADSTISYVFLVPGCASADRQDEMREEGIVDLGNASADDQGAAVRLLGDMDEMTIEGIPDSVVKALIRVVGIEMFREGDCELLTPLLPHREAADRKRRRESNNTESPPAKRPFNAK